MDLFPDNISFGQFLRVASPGDRYCYFVGDLAQFRFSAGKEMEAGGAGQRLWATSSVVGPHAGDS